MSTVSHRFGPYGGQYVPETLMPALAELELAWADALADPAYVAELSELLRIPSVSADAAHGGTSPAGRRRCTARAGSPSTPAGRST